jgi:D-3-phosphoglycerate dehydrogenase
MNPTRAVTEPARSESAAGDGAQWRVLVSDGLVPAGLGPLAQDTRFDLVQGKGLDGDALAEVLREVDAVIVRSSTRITREVLESGQRLRVIGRAGVGVDNIDVDAATEHGIAVLNAPSGNTISAAEHAFALLLALIRHIPAADRSMRAGEWDRKRFAGIELSGKTLGLVGAGRIGSEVARRARAFGMRVVVHDPFLSEEHARALDVERATLDHVLESADVLSMHVPMTESTAGMIGADQLARLRKGAVLINAARGGIVDERALQEALVSGHLRGAALDVYENEPLQPDHPLRSLPNVVLTPHLGAATEEAQHHVALEIGQAVRDAIVDGDMSRAVNAPAIAGEEMRRMKPLLGLAVQLGRLAASLLDGVIQRVDVRYAGETGEVLRPLASAALVGVLGDVVGRNAVNLVNAILLAQMRGIEVGRTRLAKLKDYAEYVELRAAGERGEATVAGALLDATHPRVVRIGDFHVDVRPRGPLLVLRNRDVPGVIGRVGTILGIAGVNIAEYHQARLGAGGEALAAIRVDGTPSLQVIEQLETIPEVLWVKRAALD